METPPTLQLRMLTELVYCPRLYHFMAVQGVMVKNAEVVEGTSQHARAEARRKKGAIEAGDDEPPWVLPKNLHLEWQEEELTGRLDVVKAEDGSLVPVEVKRGAAPDSGRPITWNGTEFASGAWSGDQVQVMGQIMLLRTNGYPVGHGELYYRANRKHVRVDPTTHLESALRAAMAQARTLAEEALPEPLMDSPKCVRCSLAPVCLPDETNLLKARTTEPPRRILPARPDGGVLYLATPGLSLGKDGEQIAVREKGVLLDAVPLKDVIQVVTFGQGVSITTPALHWLLDNGRSICHLTRGGRLLGITQPLVTQNVHLRQAQYLKFNLPELRLSMARDLVASKIRNQRTLLRRNHVDPPCLEAMAQSARRAEEADSTEQLLGIEGEAAKNYFAAFPGMLNEVWRPHMHGRSRRPPRDGVNACLSFLYMLLVRDCTIVLAEVGLDPMFGGYHTLKPGRPALALDLAEPFRPLIAESAVLRSLNTGVLEPADTVTTQAGVFLSDPGRNRLIGAYEQRMQELVTHPAFEYRLSYRRILEMEARLLARWLEGDLGAWKPLVTR